MKDYSWKGAGIVRTAEDCVSICNEAGVAGTSVPDTGTVKGAQVDEVKGRRATSRYVTRGHSL